MINPPQTVIAAQPLALENDVTPTATPAPALPEGVIAPEAEATVQRPEDRPRLDADGNPITAPKIITPTITPTPTPEILPPASPHTGPVSIAAVPPPIETPKVRAPKAQAIREAKKADVRAEIKLSDERVNNGQQVIVGLKLQSEQALAGFAPVVALPKGVVVVANSLNGAIYDAAKKE